MSYNPSKPYRFVFDIALPEEGPGFAYPSVLLLDAIPGVILELDTPNLELFKAISLLAINSIREDCFDVLLETAIASMCAAVVFKELYPSFNPFDFQDLTVPELFTELWKIHTTCDQKLIPATLAIFQDPSYPVPEDREDLWTTFVCEMSRIGSRNFVPFLQKTLVDGFQPAAAIAALPRFP
jgi:hypothetical protein